VGEIMRLSRDYFYTLREDAKDEDSTSGNLLVRSGYVKKSSSGIYMYLPLGLRVLNNIKKIIQEEMNKTGAQEVLMPSLIPEDVYVASGRRAIIGSSMFSLKDRFDKPFVLGPTHEELFAIAAAMKIRSYKDLPFNLYQFQNKFRDEPRPRFGLIRVREFIMKDAYSFDPDLAGLDESYQKMFDAYVAAFDRMKMDYKIVTADTGIMGGLLSEEFQAISEIGEDTLVLCDSCSFASNIEVAECCLLESAVEEHLPKELVATPDAKTIEEVTGFLREDAAKFVKTLIYDIDGKLYACLVRGDQEVNETKLRKLLEANELVLATAQQVESATSAPIGFAGPIGLAIPVIVDQNVLAMHNFISGANKKDYHYKNINCEDFEYAYQGDIVNIKEGDICPLCGGKISFGKGIEVGNTFKLGTKYAQALKLQYLDADNQLQDVYMGSYGIGLGRCMAALAEQNHDENGLIWNKEIAPYRVAIIPISNTDEKQVEIAERLYNSCQQLGIDAILDDRDERPGVKFKDLDLIGIPSRIVVGKDAVDGQVEFRNRTDEKSVLVAVDEVIELLK